MIKEIKLFGKTYYCPGWLNAIVLWNIYFWLAKYIKHITHSQAEEWFIALITAVACMLYLAKWRFYDGGWHFK